MSTWNESQRLLRNTLATYEVELPQNLTTEKAYYWNTTNRVDSFYTPVAKPYRAADLDDLMSVRHVPLLLISRHRSGDGQPELLFREHGKWHSVLPSMELSPIRTDLLTVRQKVVRHASRELGFEEPPQAQAAGGLFSFKTSPSYGESNCYVFPLFVVTAAGPSGPRAKPRTTERAFAPTVRSHRYLSRRALHDIPGLLQLPNGDVYRALELLHPDWSAWAPTRGSQWMSAEGSAWKTR